MGAFFTCIRYDTVDFLIQSRYVVSGVYLPPREGARSLVFNRETLPHLQVGGLLEAAFACGAKESFNIALIMRMQDFGRETRKNITEFTGTAFPASGRLALSLSGSVENAALDETALRLPPAGLRRHFAECGISALAFAPDGKKQILLSPDTLIRKFFSAHLIQAGRTPPGGER